MTGGRIARAATAVALFGIVSRLLGFVRELVLARTFGTQGVNGAKADAFVNGIFLVNTVAAIVLYALVTLIIPSFEHEREEEGMDSAWRLIWAVGAWVGIALVAIGAVVGLWPEAVAKIFNARPVTERLMVETLPIMAPGLVMQGISALLTAALQARRRYIGPAAIGVAFNLGIILGLLAGHASLKAAAWGVTLGALAQIVLQLPQLISVLREDGVRPAIRHPRLMATAALSVPILAASVLQQINGYTDKLFANGLGTGKTAALNYANAVGSAPRTALLFPLLTPLFPVVAEMIARGRRPDATRAFVRAAGLLALVSIPMSLFIAIYPHEISQLAFQRRRCTATCVHQIQGPLLWYGIAVWGAFIGYLLNRTLSAARRAHDIMVATIVTVVLTVALDVVLVVVGPLDQTGLALATMIGIYANTLLTLWYLRRQMPELSMRKLADQQGRLVLAGLIGGATCLLLNVPFPSGDRGTLAATALIAAKGFVGFVVFVVAARALAPGELHEGRRALGAIVGRGR